MAFERKLERAPRPAGLGDVLELVLDRGMLIDAYVRVSVIGIEVITTDARLAVAGVDTYLRFADAITRLEIDERTHI